jgi:hypothetical protein
MTRVLALLLAVVSAGAVAEPVATPRGRRDLALDSRGVMISPGSYVTAETYATTAAMTLNVDPTGNNNNACTSTGTGACLTIQGALNKVPKLLRHLVTINIAAGTYGSFFVSGFTCDMGVQQTAAGLLIDGLAAFTNSTIASGSATGTATSGTAGGTSTFGSLTKTAAGWTVNDLSGRFITITGGTGSGQTRVISSNTATVITITGDWTAPDATSTYAIQDPGVIINTAVSTPSPISGTSTNQAAVLISGNQCGTRTNLLVLRGIRAAPTTGSGLVFSDSSACLLTLSQMRPGGTNRGIFVGGLPQTAGGVLTAQDVDSSSSATIAAVSVTGSTKFGATRFRGHDGQGVVQVDSGARAGLVEIDGQAVHIGVDVGSASACGQASMIASRIVGNGGGSDIGVRIGTVVTQSICPSFVVVSDLAVSSLTNAVTVAGSGASADITTLTGSTSNSVFLALSGGSIWFQSSGTTATGGVADVSIDPGTVSVTAALADVLTTLPCISGSSTGSKVCAR